MVSTYNASRLRFLLRDFDLCAEDHTGFAQFGPCVVTYDARILRKTHVPVSDAVSDTDTARIRPDTYPRCIRN